MRTFVAQNVRRLARARFGTASIAKIASTIEVEPSGLYDVLGRRVDLSIGRLDLLASRLDTTASGLLCGRE